MTFGDLFRIILAFFLPPVAVIHAIDICVTHK